MSHHEVLNVDTSQLTLHTMVIIISVQSPFTRVGKKSSLNSLLTLEYESDHLTVVQSGMYKLPTYEQRLLSQLKVGTRDPRRLMLLLRDELFIWWFCAHLNYANSPKN